ncbi:hypothetical protein CRG98_030046 [Punica granatum]|uniref:Geraniol 8-hydroxylase-like n=1 Tax=Punica granatum TaxID=22663 RepID=A0A2I0J0L0_PUNGR|nr:hypothetical protein CRG98_030046 [Punica granatum]
MDASSLLWLCFLLLIFIHLLLQRQSNRGLPPGPRSLPLLGNILDLGTKPHRALTELARKHGPVMTLKLGAVAAVVVSSSEAVREVLQKNDHILSSRATPDVMRVRDHYKHSIVWLSTTSPKSKVLRKACSVQMFSRQKLDRTETLRRSKVDELLDCLHVSSIRGQEVDIGQAVFRTVLNMISNTLFSIDLARHDHEDSGLELKELLWEMVKDVGSPNISDFFPVLRWIDPQGARRRMDAYFGKLFAVFDRIIDERTRFGGLEGSRSSTRGDDMLDTLLDLIDSSELSREDINSLLLVSTQVFPSIVSNIQYLRARR